MHASIGIQKIDVLVPSEDYQFVFFKERLGVVFICKKPKLTHLSHRRKAGLSLFFLNAGRAQEG